MTIAVFRKTIWSYYRAHPRPMPWRRARDRRDPYRILVSEIMLQQTQVGRVVAFYENFIKKFPDFAALARAKTADVLQAWQGLGYNRRALALQKLAKEIVETKDYKGRLPRDRATLESLPGIGSYTAGAIRAFAFNEPEIFIETNIRRVFIHFFFPTSNAGGKKSDKKVTDAELHRYIGRTLERKKPREWYYALMDYGVMLGEIARRGTRDGKSIRNPNRRSAHYARQSKFAGSDREIRGKILRTLLTQKKTGKKIPSSSLPENIILRLCKDGFIIQQGKYIKLA